MDALSASKIIQGKSYTRKNRGKIMNKEKNQGKIRKLIGYKEKIRKK